METINLTEIGARVRARRKGLGWTQEHLAERMDVSSQMISCLERGVKSIQIDNLVRLSRALNISTDYILTGFQPDDNPDRLAERIARLRPEHRKVVDALVACCLQER